MDHGSARRDTIRVVQNRAGVRGPGPGRIACHGRTLGQPGRGSGGLAHAAWVRWERDAAVFSCIRKGARAHAHRLPISESASHASHLPPPLLPTHCAPARLSRVGPATAHAHILVHTHSPWHTHASGGAGGGRGSGGCTREGFKYDDIRFIQGKNSSLIKDGWDSAPSGHGCGPRGIWVVTGQSVDRRR
jgi:hypothetical protein